MSLVNNEYPIDDSFNYQDYLKNADIPSKYENYVKEIATQFYNENKKNRVWDNSVSILSKKATDLPLLFAWLR